MGKLRALVKPGMPLRGPGDYLSHAAYLLLLAAALLLVAPLFIAGSFEP